MRKVFFIALAIVMSAANAGFAEDAGDGWFKTRWGMTSEDLVALFGDEVKAATPAIAAYGKTYSYVIEKLMVGPFAFKVFFSMGDNDGLKSVLLRRDDYATATNCFNFVQLSLLKKYGPFFDKEKEVRVDDSGNEYEVFQRKWITKSTAILMTHYYDMDPQSSTILIAYFSRSRGAVDGL